MKKVNIFTVMLVVATFAIVLRLLDISDFSTPHSVAESTPAPQKFEQVEQPPSADALAEPKKAVEAVPEAAKDAPPAVAGGEKMPAPMSSVYGEHAYSAAELDVLQSLSKRRDELDKRAQDIGQREALLKAAEGEVDRKITELNKIKTDLVALLDKQKTIQDERINSLVKIYENMKPKEAARIFDTLDMDVLLAVIGKMKENKASPVLANMDPEKARTVTIKLTEQHKLPELQNAPAAAPAATAPAVPAPAPAPAQAP